MQTTAVHKNIGLVLFVIACALILAFGISGHAQGRGNGNRDKTLWEGRNDNDRSKNKDDKDDQGKRWADHRGKGARYDDQDDRINGRDRRGNQSVRFAYQRGYKEGFKDGKRAAKDRRRGVVYNDASFPTNGNRNGWGRSPEWRRAYEEGYRRGFRDGYDRHRRDDRRYDDRKILGIPVPF